MSDVEGPRRIDILNLSPCFARNNHKRKNYNPPHLLRVPTRPSTCFYMDVDFRGTISSPDLALGCIRAVRASVLTLVGLCFCGKGHRAFLHQHQGTHKNKLSPRNPFWLHVPLLAPAPNCGPVGALFWCATNDRPSLSALLFVAWNRTIGRTITHAPCYRCRRCDR